MIRYMVTVHYTNMVAGGETDISRDYLVRANDAQGAVLKVLNDTEFYKIRAVEVHRNSVTIL